MPDKVEYTCKHCNHKKADHGRYFDVCYACWDNRKSSQCKFERIDNLTFLERVVKEQEL